MNELMILPTIIVIAIVFFVGIAIWKETEIIEVPRAVTQAEQDALLTKQWRARIYFMSSPTRKSYNNRWRAKFKRRAKRLASLK